MNSQEAYKVIEWYGENYSIFRSNSQHAGWNAELRKEFKILADNYLQMATSRQWKAKKRFIFNKNFKGTVTYQLLLESNDKTIYKLLKQAQIFQAKCTVLASIIEWNGCFDTSELPKLLQEFIDWCFWYDGNFWPVESNYSELKKKNKKLYPIGGYFNAENGKSFM